MKTRTMTAAQQPQERLTTVVRYTAGGIVWATQAAAATAYLGAAGRPSMWQPTFTKDYPSAICMVAFVVCTIALWVISMFGERAWFYDRLQQRNFRRLGLACHLGVVLIATLTVSKTPERVAWWAALGIFCFSATVTWAAWMELKLLPEEDQAVIDTIIRREAAERAAVFDVSERQKRRQRLTALVESLGYTLTDASPQTARPADPPAIKWTVPPGKHKPLVYFIRNGNRLKIGTTTALKHRIRTLALRAENIALLVDGGQNVEHAFHKQFAEHRIGNTEWFAYEGSLADYVRGEAGRISREGQGQ